ncbi:DsbA family protein [Dryocola clanedunensis]
MLKTRLSIIFYSLFLIIVSALITTGYFHLFVFGSAVEDQEQVLKKIPEAQVAGSPIKEENTIVEIISYGCHYCAVSEKDISRFEQQLPPTAKLIRLHFSTPALSGLASYASVFATLSVMGIEAQYRGQAYKAILEENINLADETQLEKWLLQNGIDRLAYLKASQSPEREAMLTYMTEVSQYYGINATPTFIVGKKWLAQQEGDFPTFSKQLMSLLQHDKPLDR